jgi:hypothetical protein
MKRKLVTWNYTWSGLFGDSPLFFIAGVVLAVLGHTPWMGLVAVAVVAGLIVQLRLNNRKLKQRQEAISELIAAKPEYKLLTQAGESAPWFRNKLGAIDELYGVRDPSVANVIGTDAWTYGDFTYHTYGKAKNGEYIRTRVYYGVMTTALPRELPHVFFDSIKARRRQFRFHFNNDQRHSLEGDFDKYFVTYFPDGYTIDSMSFISPDVMLKLRDARDYDIEIFGNRLFLYGPLYDPKTQIEDMSAKIAAIKKELLDNILTYRDDRLPYALGRKKVAIQGASLKISRFWKIVGWVSFAGYIILRMAIEIIDSQ